MDQRIKEIWIDRLENDDIPQTTSCLGTPEGGRCCLGVLCDIAVEEGVIQPPELSASGNSLFYNGSLAVLPLAVREWAGMSTDNGGFNERDNITDDPDRIYTDALSYQNDCGKTFPEIAQIIREKF